MTWTAHATPVVRIQDTQLAAQTSLINGIVKNLPRGVNTSNAGHPAATTFATAPVPAGASLSLTSPVDLLLALPVGILGGSIFLGVFVAAHIPFIQNIPALEVPAIVISAIVVSPFLAIGVIVGAVRSLLTGAAAVASTPAAAASTPTAAKTQTPAQPLPTRSRHRSSAGAAVPVPTKPLSTAAAKPGGQLTEAHAPKRESQPRQHLQRTRTGKQKSAHAG